jgi:hypothetical protein
MELEHYMWVDRDPPEPGETPYDLADAFEDADDFGVNNQDTELIKICKLILIELGYYVPMSQKEISNTYVTKGTVWSFKMKGIPYKEVDSFGGWLEK